MPFMATRRFALHPLRRGGWQLRYAPETIATASQALLTYSHRKLRFLPHPRPTTLLLQSVLLRLLKSTVGRHGHVLSLIRQMP